MIDVFIELLRYRYPQVRNNYLDSHYKLLQGDSGGPLACYTGGRWMLAGATSWGISGCTTRGYPSVYTRVSQFTQWIETTMARY